MPEAEEKKRVVVTGLGAVTPIGVGVDEFWAALIAGKNGIHRISRFDSSAFASRIAGEIRDFDPNQWIDVKTVRRTDRATQFGLAAAGMAMVDSGLESAGFDSQRAGTIVGSGIGGIDTLEKEHLVYLNKGPKAVSPFVVAMVMINMTASMISIAHGLRGPISAPSVACSTGTNAIGEAFRTIQDGRADIMLAGGTEACITPLLIGAFSAARALSRRNDSPETASRPFDRTRDGFVMGEGSGVVVLESLTHARDRGAKIYAELIGFGNTADAFHFTAPEPTGEGMVRVMDTAMADAGITPDQIDYINAHGTSTLLNDRIESKAVLKVFDDHADRLKISSIKSMIGHLIAAAGAVEFVATVKALKKGKIPPTINYREPDPDCPLDYVTGGAESLDVNVALTNSFGFGGGNACLVLRKYRPDLQIV